MMTALLRATACCALLLLLLGTLPTLAQTTSFDASMRLTVQVQEDLRVEVVGPVKTVPRKGGWPRSNVVVPDDKTFCPGVEVLLTFSGSAPYVADCLPLIPQHGGPDVDLPMLLTTEVAYDETLTNISFRMTPAWLPDGVPSAVPVLQSVPMATLAVEPVAAKTTAPVQEDVVFSELRVFGPPEDQINLVFLAEAYRKDEEKDQEALFYSDVEQIINEMRTDPLMPKILNRFNIYTIFPPRRKIS